MSLKNSFSRSAIVASSSQSRRVVSSEVMREERNEKDDRNRHAYEIEQNRTHGISSFLNRPDMIALPTADRGGIARTKRAYQQRQENPEQKVRNRLPGFIFRLSRSIDRV